MKLEETEKEQEKPKWGHFLHDEAFTREEILRIRGYDQNGGK